MAVTFYQVSPLNWSFATDNTFRNTLSRVETETTFGRARLVFGELRLNASGNSYNTGGIFFVNKSATGSPPGPGLLDAFGAQSVFQLWSIAPIFSASSGSNGIEEFLTCKWNAATQKLQLFRSTQSAEAEFPDAGIINTTLIRFAALVN